MEDDDLLFHHEAGFEVWRVRWYALSMVGGYSRFLLAFPSFYFLFFILADTWVQISHPHFNFA
jgi:hypothetical protein